MEKAISLAVAQRPAPFAWPAQDLHESGAVGDATQGLRGEGRQLLDHGARAFCELLANVDNFDVTAFDREPDAGVRCG